MSNEPTQLPPNEASLNEEQLLSEDIPKNGQPFRYDCPVDHRGNTVHIRGWRCKDSQEKPALVLVHDVGETISDYRKCAKYVCDMGYSCYSYNQRGEGRQKNDLQHTTSFDALVNDLTQVCAWIRHIHAGKPPIIVGQGYGCIVACEFLSRQDLIASGAVLCAPTIELAHHPSVLKRELIKFLSDVAPDIRLPKILLPRFSNPPRSQKTRISSQKSSSSPRPQTRRWLSSNFARELLEAMEHFPTAFARIHVPMLVIRPGEDEVARFETMASIIAQHPHQDLIDVSSFDGLHHNPLSEGQDSMEHVTNEMLAWIKSHHSIGVLR